MPQLNPNDAQRQWVVPERTEATIVGQLLKNRGIRDPDRFFTPNFERDSHDPWLLPEMAVSVARILEAIAQREPIAVYADYDADGIPGGALLVTVLRANGATVVPYIPDREREGYGLNEPALHVLKAQGVRLVITVDLGITNARQVTTARQLGLEVIVTDHHHVDAERIPHDAVGRVHPTLPGSHYPFAGLAGGGVAWKLVQALAQRTGTPSLPDLKWLIDLPAISTVCDMVPLTDENRMIVFFGLKVLRRTKNLGLAALIHAAGLDPRSLTERSIGFHIGPRLNAPGRIAHGNLALELLLSSDRGPADGLADRIEGHNRDRKEQLIRIVHEATAQVAAYGATLPAALVVVGKGWPTGLMGLAASRLTELVHRPVIVLGLDESGLAKGSGRSIPGFDLLAGLHEQREMLRSYGGHRQAAGLQLAATDVASFRSAFTTYAASRLTPADLIPTSAAEAELDPAELSLDLVNQLAPFAPFGVGNPVPRFIVRSLTVTNVGTVGADRSHLRLTFRQLPTGAIGFRLASRAALISPGSVVSAIGSIYRSVWNGRERLEFQLSDVVPMGSESIALLPPTR